ncbi:hypothetical protein [Campylobacter corcagiensis]|uniref:Uncharacterized protein n=1 Tax=Campylobacter corcagiensis TaxID=1448857 RepID=A0A7M1LFT7_9BACT|nr:hypothetical protein [Campylobacter corcagiensis]QKF64534.1 hypothetical protein CCORG_0668 [Campylobacter corcagiensis]QOQ87290.1 hypothetical protein IMC76_00220 [Campylobacter corcagiensis]
MSYDKEIETLKKEIEDLKTAQEERIKNLESLLDLQLKNSQNIESINKNIKTISRRLSPADRKRLRYLRNRKITQTVGVVLLFTISVLLMIIVVFNIYSKI